MCTQKLAPYKAFIIFSLCVVIITACASFIFYTHKQASAAAGDNVFGWAWSSNIGWISMSSSNCDSDNNGQSDGIVSGCPAAGIAIPPYGVTINPSTGVFSGYGWSENIGWINFAPSSGYPGAPNQGATLVGNSVVGWAKADAGGTLGSGGWDGWIKMSGSWSNGVGITGNNLGGFAWGSDVVGWISMSSKNCDANGNGQSDGSPAGCPSLGTPISPYGVVYVKVPTGDLKANGVNTLIAADTTPVIVSWTTSDATNCHVDPVGLTGTSNSGADIGTLSSGVILGLYCSNGAYFVDTLVDFVNVTIDNVAALPTLDVDKKVVVHGEQFILTWDTNSNAPETCSLRGAGLSPNPQILPAGPNTGNVIVSAVGAATYILTCPGGSARVSVEIRPRIFES